MNNNNVLEDFFVWEEKSLIDQNQNLLKNAEQDKCVTTIETKTNVESLHWKDITKTKKCNKCQLTKPILEFGIRSSNIKYKYKNQCKICINKTRKIWRNSNINSFNEKQREYKKNNSEKIKLWRSKNSRINPINKMLNAAKSRAKKNNLSFDLQKSDIVIPENCPVLGIPLKRNVGGKTHSYNSPSLDRINSSKGYIKGNVMVISDRANRLKNNGKIEEFEKIISYMNKYSHS
jgi:hypothetical protein